MTREPERPGVQGRIYRRRLRHLFDRATVILAVSELIADKARSLGAPEAKLRTHYIGIPLTDAVSSEAEQDIDILFVGRLVEKKGVDDLIRALAILRGASVGPSTVVVVPSKTAADGDMEGLPTVLMEAMAVGAPVVSTRHSGITEVVEHEVTGLLSAEADPAALAVNLARASADPELRRRLGDAGREHIRQNFSMAAQTAVLETIYLEVIAASAGRS